MIANPMQKLEDFKEALKNIASKTEIDFFLIHTDALRAPFRPKSRTPEGVLKEYVSDLEIYTNGINYALPSFNYDFTKTGIYSVPDSESQVGAINEFIRKSNPANRTLTPVFSHIYKNEIDFSQNLMPCDPFSSTSFYGYLRKKNTILLHYGSEIVHSTLLHFIERIGKSLLYRYDKIFRGVVYDFDNRKFDTELIYHVRPKSVRLIYD